MFFLTGVSMKKWTQKFPLYKIIERRQVSEMKGTKRYDKVFSKTA